ncbi:MAG: hypothetical protein O7H41_11680 [Planctomycetota bacterium]|nr:hypothetical protein [Planctomycetota bacterium]
MWPISKLVRRDPFEEYRTTRIVQQKEQEYRRKAGIRRATSDITRRIVREQESARARRQDTSRRSPSKTSQRLNPSPFVVEDYFKS